MIASTIGGGKPDDGVRRALVVKRPGGEVGAQHYATRSRRMTPIGRRQAVEQFRRRPQCGREGATAPRKSSASTRVPMRAFQLDDACARRHRGAAERRPGEHDAREAAAAEAILVIHRRLVHEVGEVVLASRRRVRKKIRSAPRTTASVL